MELFNGRRWNGAEWNRLELAKSGPLHSRCVGSGASGDSSAVDGSRRSRSGGALPVGLGGAVCFWDYGDGPRETIRVMGQKFLGDGANLNWVPGACRLRAPKTAQLPARTELQR